MNNINIQEKEYINIVLYEPRIPQNTGCIGRTSAALKVKLILIEPLGFSLDNKYLKRAGLDYWPFIDLQIHPNYSKFTETISDNHRIIACSKSNGNHFKKFNYRNGDYLLFGREDVGLPDYIKQESDHIVSIPMPGISSNEGNDGVRSLNLAVSAGIISYEACSQLKLI